jgi:hypothetical protein
VCCETRESVDFPRTSHLSLHGTDICTYCITNYLKGKIDEGSTDIACPAINCHVSLPYSEIKEHSDKDVFVRYLQFYLLLRLTLDLINCFAKGHTKQTQVLGGVPT